MNPFRNADTRPVLGFGGVWSCRNDDQHSVQAESFEKVSVRYLAISAKNDLAYFPRGFHFVGADVVKSTKTAHQDATILFHFISAGTNLVSLDYNL